MGTVVLWNSAARMDLDLKRRELVARLARCGEACPGGEGASLYSDTERQRTLIVRQAFTEWVQEQGVPCVFGRFVGAPTELEFVRKYIDGRHV